MVVPGQQFAQLHRRSSRGCGQGRPPPAVAKARRAAAGMVRGCGVVRARQWRGVPGNRKNRRNQEESGRECRQAPRAENEDRTPWSDTKRLAVAVQRAAASPGRRGAQRSWGTSQALPHRMCATHGWSVRRAERPGPRPWAPRRAHGVAGAAHSTALSPSLSPGRPPAAGEWRLWTMDLSCVHAATQPVREAISARRQRPCVSDTAVGHELLAYVGQTGSATA